MDIPEYPGRQLPQVPADFEQLARNSTVQLGAPVQFTILTVDATSSTNHLVNNKSV